MYSPIDVQVNMPYFPDSPQTIQFSKGLRKALF